MKHPGGMTAREEVVLLDETGSAIGTAAKSEVHHDRTPLHLAFSCYVLDEQGRLLVTQRAAHKLTFGGVWTNSACGHPAPGEPIADAVRRRVQQELGLSLDDLRLVLPGFRTEPGQLREVRHGIAQVQSKRAVGCSDLRRSEGLQPRRSCEPALHQLWNSGTHLPGGLHLAQLERVHGPGRVLPRSEEGLWELRHPDLHQHLLVGNLRRNRRMRAGSDQTGQLRQLLASGLQLELPVADQVRPQGGQSVRVQGRHQLAVLRSWQVAVLRLELPMVSLPSLLGLRLLMWMWMWMWM